MEDPSELDNLLSPGDYNTQIEQQQEEDDGDSDELDLDDEG